MVAEEKQESEESVKDDGTINKKCRPRKKKKKGVSVLYDFSLDQVACSFDAYLDTGRIFLYLRICPSIVFPFAMSRFPPYQLLPCPCVIGISPQIASPETGRKNVFLCVFNQIKKKIGKRRGEPLKWRMINMTCLSERKWFR